MKKGFRRLYTSLHKTDRKRSARLHEAGEPVMGTPIPNWWKCTTLKPLEPA